MTPAEALEKMEEIKATYAGDPEAGHAAADRFLSGILVNLGYQDAVEVYDSMIRWCA